MVSCLFMLVPGRRGADDDDDDDDDGEGDDDDDGDDGKHLQDGLDIGATEDT